MDRVTEIRGKVMTALSGYKHNGVAVPVFDEVVNPSVALPTIEGAQVYIMLQDQQQVPNAVQTICYPRNNINLTIRVVTIFGPVGNKKLSEDIGDEVLNLIRDNRGGSKLSGIKDVELPIARSLSEVTAENISFSKILILNFVKNG
jgi:hypothetical protein